MNSHVSHGSYSSKVRKSFSMPSNSEYHMSRLVMGRNSDAYKLTIEKKLSIPPSKTFVRRKALLLAM